MPPPLIHSSFLSASQCAEAVACVHHWLQLPLPFSLRDEARDEGERGIGATKPIAKAGCGPLRSRFHSGQAELWGSRGLRLE